MAWLLSLKVLFTSIGVVSSALALKLSVPFVLELSRLYVPLMWSCFLAWLKPPYLYVVINGIIITIAASSRFYQKESDEDYVAKPSSERVSPDLDYEAKISPRNRLEFGVTETPLVYEQGEELTIPELPSTERFSLDLGYEENGSSENGLEFRITEITPVYEQREEVIISDVRTEEANVSAETEAEDEDDSQIVTSRSTRTPPMRTESSEFYLYPAEKPLVSTRFGHRKPAKASPEGDRKALKVSKPKRNETLENTWKAITEGRAMPLSRHMKKCETWENHNRQINVSQLDHSPVKKLETFEDRTNLQQLSPAAPSKLRKEPSPSQDELNRRVEAFINKFNEEMRLQRQESLNQYWEMIGRESN